MSQQTVTSANNFIVPIPLNVTLPPYTISLYVLRIADINDTWSIQAVFDNGMKFNFIPIRSLTAPKVNSFISVDKGKNDIYLE